MSTRKTTNVNHTKRIYFNMKRTKADDLFSKYIRSRDGWRCVYCHKEYQEGERGLHCSHYHSRGKWTVRFDEENADAHCHSCHQFLGSNPHHFSDWKKKQLGSERYDNLLLRSNLTLKDVGLTKKELEAQIVKKYKGEEAV
jgi:hypothetical protein